MRASWRVLELVGPRPRVHRPRLEHTTTTTTSPYPCIPCYEFFQPAVLFSQNKPATSQQYFSLTANQHQPSATRQTNKLFTWLYCIYQYVPAKKDMVSSLSFFVLKGENYTLFVDVLLHI
jgi:hypothetical protein